MSQIGAIINRIKHASFKRMFDNIEKVHEDKGKSRVLTLLDMVYSFARYHVGYLDYVAFGFADIGHDKRKTYFVMADNIHYTEKFNSPRSTQIIDDKSLFCKTYREFLHRDFMDLRDEGTGPDTLKEFCQGKEAVFAKQPVSYGGLGVQKVELSEDTDYDVLYKTLTDGKLYHIEDLIIQHPDMEKLSPGCVNTLRICTVRHDGKANLMYALLRMGNGKAVDNITSGGLYTAIKEDGTLCRLAFCDVTSSYYDKHPISGTTFDHYAIPFYNEAVKLCLDASEVLPDMEYLGWDVAITPDGPVMVEANDLPGYDMYQNHKFHDDHCGMKEKFREAFGE